MSPPRNERSREAISRALLAVRGLLQDDALEEVAREALLEAPHRFVPLGATSLAAVRLEGLMNLRLALMHGSLDPRDVGEARAARARAVIAVLDRAEREAFAELERTAAEEEVALRYETSRFLHPAPPFASPVAHRGTSAELASLVARWERVRENGLHGFAWLAQKAKQHLQFDRFGLGFPLYEARRRRFARALPASIARHATMRETYSAIEQLGPILDNFVFDRGLRAAFEDDVVVTDFAFLYMQLADELVDNLVKLGGEQGLCRLLDELYAGDRRAAVFVPFEDLDDAALLRAGIDPEAPITKYAMSVRAFVATLRELRAALLAATGRSASPDATKGEVSRFFHHCFATFLDELELGRLTGEPRLAHVSYASVAWHFRRKNDEVMTRFMALRARLLGLDPNDLGDVLARWGTLLASFQIFDDLKDVGLDLGHQPSYPLMIARSDHPAELAYLEHDFGPRDRSLDRNEVMELSVNAARTVRDALRWGRLLALLSFDWFLDYVADYRWRRNWLVRGRSFHRAPAVDLPVERGPLARYVEIDTKVPVVDALFRFLAARGADLNGGVIGDGELAYALDVVGYDHGGAVLRALLPDLGRAYRFANLRMRMSERERAEVVRLVLRRHREAARAGLRGLEESTGSLGLTHAVARAVGLPVEGRFSAGRRSGRPRR